MDSNSKCPLLLPFLTPWIPDPELLVSRKHCNIIILLPVLLFPFKQCHTRFLNSNVTDLQLVRSSPRIITSILEKHLNKLRLLQNKCGINLPTYTAFITQPNSTIQNRTEHKQWPSSSSGSSHLVRIPRTEEQSSLCCRKVHCLHGSLPSLGLTFPNTLSECKKLQQKCYARQNHSCYQHIQGWTCAPTEQQNKQKAHAVFGPALPMNSTTLPLEKEKTLSLQPRMS